MAGVQLVLPGEIVKKSNALMRCRWTIESVWEPRLVAFLASMVNTNDTDFQEYEIPIVNIIPKPEQKKGGNTYKDIEDVVDKIMSRVITIYNDKGWTKYHLFSVCRLDKEKNTIAIKFDPVMRPHYLQLKERFSEYNLIEFMMLSSVYSQRMFEILKSWDDKQEVIIPIGELYDMLDAPDYLRGSYKDFRHRVLEKAYKDITTKTSLRYEWEGIKKGRSITSIKFTFPLKQIAQPTKERVEKRKLRLQEIAGECAGRIGAGVCYVDNDKEVCEICKEMNIFNGYRG